MSHSFPPTFPTLDEADILVVPGRGSSCEAHWQSHFERRHANARRVQQENWEAPDLDTWALRIATAALQSDRPVLVVAHSFGCLALARAVTYYDADIDAALLVAPAAPERFDVAPTTLARRLPVPTLLIASDNDPWLATWQALDLTKLWGSDYTNLGLAGHINVAAGFGEWKGVDGYAERIWREAAKRAGAAALPNASRGGNAVREIST